MAEASHLSKQQFGSNSTDSMVSKVREVHSQMSVGCRVCGHSSREGNVGLLQHMKDNHPRSKEAKSGKLY